MKYALYEIFPLYSNKIINNNIIGTKRTWLSHMLALSYYENDKMSLARPIDSCIATNQLGSLIIVGAVSRADFLLPRYHA